jgi:hypothetical protein
VIAKFTQEGLNVTRPTNDHEWRPELEDLVPGLRPQAGDELPLVLAVKEDLMRELAPVTTYEKLLAGQLVSLELDTIRLRHMMDSVLLSALLYRMERAARNRSQTSQPGDDTASQADVDAGAVMDTFDAEMAKIDQMKRDISRADPELAEAMNNALQAAGLDPVRIQAEIRQAYAERIEPFEMRLLAAEERRRRLRADYDRLIAARPRDLGDVDDADFDEALRDAF